MEGTIISTISIERQLTNFQEYKSRQPVFQLGAKLTLLTSTQTPYSTYTLLILLELVSITVNVKENEKHI
jgi:hypothetical protein